MKRLTLVALGIFAFFATNAQTDEFRKNYSEFRQQAQADYENFRKKVNGEYAEWMRQAWEWHKRIEPFRYSKEEMLPPVIYDEEKGQGEPKPIYYEVVVQPPTPEPQPKPIAPIRENEGDYCTATFTFFGTEGHVRLPKDFAFKLKGKDEDAYANAWEELSSDGFANLLRDCLVLRMEYQLCDWAYLMMLGAMSEAICGKGTNEAAMMQAYVYCQSGYKVRLGFTEERDLRLLFKSDHAIYDLDAFEMQDGLFYLLQPIEGDGLSICDISYPEERPLSLWITQEQKFAEQTSAERLLTSRGGMVSVKSQVNENLLKFFDTYPPSVIDDNVVSRWAMYANAPLSEQIKARLYPQLKVILKQVQNTEEAAGLLLYWVQTAFVYEYDDKVWGHDRAFFAEETLYYPYCDCEDRSILYSRLVRDLLGLDVILVFYPGHLATAVNFKTPIIGDYIDLGDRRFTICDPTYIGAPIGATMPDMNNQTAKVILLGE